MGNWIITDFDTFIRSDSIIAITLDNGENKNFAVCAVLSNKETFIVWEYDTREEAKKGARELIYQCTYKPE